MKLALDELKRLQREHDLLDKHMVSIDRAGFVIAHTDAERESHDDLRDCKFHSWMMEFDEPPVEPGEYVVTSDYWEGWEFHPWTP